MSMTTIVYGIIPATEKHFRMVNAYLACDNAGIPIPAELREYFGDEVPDPKGMVKYISSPLNRHPAVSVYDSDYQSGYEINLEKLEKDIKILRFVNSY